MDFKFKKKYGQNFLTDKNIIKKIIDSIRPQENDLIIEIGLGSGALTKYLVTKTNYYLGYEIDNEVSKFLRQYESLNKTIVYDDFLKRNVEDDIKGIPYRNVFIIGNLPYYITTPIILKIMEENINIKECVFMVQKEVAERFSAKPGNREYGAISVLLNYYFDIEYLFDVNRKSFVPSPNVDSAIIKLICKKDRIPVNIANLNKIIKDSFQYKRKNIRNNLKNYDLSKVECILKEYGLTLNDRAEDFPLEVFIQIANECL